MDNDHDGRRGPSSLWLHDPEVVFREIDLRPGAAFLDLGCGPGDYAIAAARRVGSAGTVYALDKSPLMVDRLRGAVDARGLANIEASVADLTGRLPLADGCIDRCLICTVLHIFGPAGLGRVAFGEIRRVLKPDGHLAVIELKREEQPFGPPMQRRLAPEAVEAAIGRHGFDRFSLVALQYTYLIQFRRSGHSGLDKATTPPYR